MSQEPTLRSAPTLRIRVRRRLGGAICWRRGHRPVLVERHYLAESGPAQVLGEVHVVFSDRSFTLLGRVAEERVGREVICRRCLVTCGDTMLGEGR